MNIEQPLSLVKPTQWNRNLSLTQHSVAQPESRQALQHLIVSHKLLGETGDGKKIYLYQRSGLNTLIRKTVLNETVLREIGRLREISFRAVGEGTGKCRDLDQYDASYSQLVLWDEFDLEIVGAYRLADASDIIVKSGLKGLYTASLFDYESAIIPILKQGVELGRSFVQPTYWGKRSLDYLWYGIGSYLTQNPHIRYLFGPVSLSNDMPKPAKDLMVYFFSMYFGQPEHQRAFLKASGTLNSEKYRSSIPNSLDRLAHSKRPYRLTSDLINSLKKHFTGDDYKQDFKTLKRILGNMGCSIPTLFKQYSDLCELDGLVFLDFGIDEGFGDCIDGLVIVDVTKIKQKKRARYMPSSMSNEPSLVMDTLRHATDSKRPLKGKQ